MIEIEPTESDLLAAAELESTLDSDVDWEALLEPVIVVASDEDDDECPWHDDRYDGSGVPSWSAWA